VQLSEISAVPVYTDSMSPFETYDDLSSMDNAPLEESMRVRYEDPGQQNEKKRLMNLLKTSVTSQSAGAGGSDDKAGKATRSRRSTRIAGF
jgi:DNA replication regulator DPB11